MSTLKVAAIKNESSSANNIVLNTDGTTTVGSITSSGTVSGATVTSTGTVSGATVTSTGTVSGATVTSTGDVNDSVSDVRTPRHTQLTGASNHNLTNEGVYVVDASSTFSQIIIGTGATLTAGTIMTIYNNRSTSVTISRGSIPNMRNAADGDYTNYATRTLGRNSVTTVTMFYNNLIILTGTDIT